MADQFRVLRYAGAVASAGLATGAWLAGALPVPGADEVLHERGFGAMPALFNGGVAVSLAAAAGWLLVWWRLLVTGAVTGDGTRVGAGDPDPPGGSGGRWPRPRWVAATGLVWAFPLLLAPPLAARDVYSYACQGWLHVDGADPYGVGPAAGACPWLESVAPLWRHTTAPYGPLGIEASSAAVWPATAVPLDLPGRLLLAITLLRVVALVGVGLAGWGAVRLAGACGVPPGPALLAGVVSPLMAIHAVSGAHNDALLAGLILSGLAVLATGSLGTGPPGTGSLGTGSLGNHRAVAVALAGGAVLGLAAAIKITSVIVVPFAAILVAGRCPAAGRYLRSRVIAGVLAGAAGTYAAMMWLTGLGLGWLGSLRSTADLVQWTSPPTAVGMLLGYVLRVLGRPEAVGTAVAGARAVGVAVLAAVLLALLHRAVGGMGEVRSVVRRCGLALAAVVVLSPVAYPWYALAPLAVLAVTADARHYRWLAVAGCVLTLLVLPNGVGVAGLTKFPGALVVGSGAVALASVMVRRTRAGEAPAESATRGRGPAGR